MCEVDKRIYITCKNQTAQYSEIAQCLADAHTRRTIGRALVHEARRAGRASRKCQSTPKKWEVEHTNS